MKILQFDSVGGASGDMILGALIQLGTQLRLLDVEKDIVEPLKQLISDPFSLRWEEKSSHGMSGRALYVDLPDQGKHEQPEGTSAKPHEHEHGCINNNEHAHSHEHKQRHTPEHAHVYGHVHGLEHGLEHELEHGHFCANHAPAHAHFHRSFADIRRLIEASGALPKSVKRLSLAVFTALAEAEGKIHGKPMDEVHFHEVGAVDSIIDTIGACLALDKLGADAVVVSPLPTGTGLIQCAHGTYPIPAPATAALLERFDMAISTDNEQCEMVTPTGAAELSVWSKQTHPLTQPRQNARIAATVHSFGHREMTNRPNLLRLSLYETSDKDSDRSERSDANLGGGETALPCSDNAAWLSTLECNLDDATGERLSVVMQNLFEAGALDVWFVPITMKKQRCGILLGVLLTPDRREQALDVLFRESGTFGVRETLVRRYSLDRRWETVETPFGPIRVKIGLRAGTVQTVAPEFDDCASAAKKSGVPLHVVMQTTVAAYSGQ